MKELQSQHPVIKFGKIGVLIINLGTPDSTKRSDIRKYLKEFLSDKRVIEINRVLWFIVLNLIILNTRPSKASRAYKKIWMNEVNESPLLYYTKKQSKMLSKEFQNHKNIIIDYAMRYGNPSIKEKINTLSNQGCEKLVIFPLYPQYSAATTASVCDEVYRSLLKMRWQPSLQVIHHYEADPLYILALANSVKSHLKKLPWKPDMLLVSYHGIPRRYFLSGDPYHCYCMKTTRMLSSKLKFNIPLRTSFQSRFGPEEWLTPYTDKLLESLPKEKIKNLAVICPGFSSDCIETLEEIEMEGKETFHSNGGEKFTYIPCLNYNQDHIKLMKTMIKRYI